MITSIWLMTLIRTMPFTNLVLLAGICTSDIYIASILYVLCSWNATINVTICYRNTGRNPLTFITNQIIRIWIIWIKLEWTVWYTILFMKIFIWSTRSALTSIIWILAQQTICIKTVYTLIIVFILSSITWNRCCLKCSINW